MPLLILLFVAILYELNRKTNFMKCYFHLIFIPVAGYLTAKESIQQNQSNFYLNASFPSWILLMLFGSFSSSMQWYSVATINCLCFLIYIVLIFNFYGYNSIRHDFYIHISTTIIMSTCLIRMNEVNLRNSFSLLNQSKIQERKWRNVLRMLTDGVLIMQHTDDDSGILLINDSLQKIFGHGGNNN